MEKSYQEAIKLPGDKKMNSKDCGTSSFLKARALSVSFLLCLLLIASGCQFTQSAFAKTAGNVGATFSVAATTIQYVHQGKLSVAYAHSSFENYQRQLQGADSQMPNEAGVPDKQTLTHLLDLYRTAMQAINNPCLNSTCDWRSQVAQLSQASKAFVEASGS
ncbi:MAG TPA: hypothetical protein VFA41_04950 [Ktedonobacteraceae bacterium]|jgi:hypothetical protein|nr:hypothetical protein [Ktedonobacteraceae bacterium]